MAQKLPSSGSILGLDLGGKRIGVAVASVAARLPRPLDLVQNDEQLLPNLEYICKSEDIKLLVVGVPRNLSGEETAQSRHLRNHGEALAKQLQLKVVFVDESLSSHRADEALATSKKPTVSQDSLAACFILDEFFATIGVVHG